MRWQGYSTEEGELGSVEGCYDEGPSGALASTRLMAVGRGKMRSAEGLSCNFDLELGLNLMSMTCFVTAKADGGFSSINNHLARVVADQASQSLALIIDQTASAPSTYEGSTISMHLTIRSSKKTGIPSAALSAAAEAQLEHSHF